MLSEDLHCFSFTFYQPFLQFDSFFSSVISLSILCTWHFWLKLWLELCKWQKLFTTELCRIIWEYDIWYLESCHNIFQGINHVLWYSMTELGNFWKVGCIVTWNDMFLFPSMVLKVHHADAMVVCIDTVESQLLFIHSEPVQCLTSSGSAFYNSRISLMDYFVTSFLSTILGPRLCLILW